MTNKSIEFDQYFTPAWAAEILFDRYFSYLTAKDLVWEPTCGSGAMLAAIPSNIMCVGSEIDPELAEVAMRNTRRNIIVGDCLTCPLPDGITAVFGNPPFDLDLFSRLMNRCVSVLDYGRKAGFLIPAYFLQTSRSVMKLSRKWTIHHDILPRDLFPSLTKPLLFAQFTRENNPELFGFTLFREMAAMRDEFNTRTKDMLAQHINGTRGVWKETIRVILDELGGTASLDSIYGQMRSRRPTENQYWKEKVRQVCQQSFHRIDKGVYSLKEAA